MRGARGGAGTEWLAWLVVLLAAAILLPAAGYRSRDPDSALHAHIAARLAALPVDRWIAPEWWGGMRSEGLYREHPAGIFLLPALLGKLGYPPAQAAYAVNALYQVLTLVLLQRVAAVLVAPVESRALAWLLQLLPIAFTYRVRANHEQVILLCLLAALWGTERARYGRDRARWVGLTALAVVGTLLVKGLFALLVLGWCAVWLATVRRADDAAPGADAGAWLGLGAAAAAAVGVGVGYERLYRLSDRKADRYIPAYYLVGACGLIAAIRGWPALRRVVETLDGYHPVLPAAVWLLTFGLSRAGGALHLPRLKFWAAE